MYSIDEIKELLAAFDASKATAVDICLGENECISIRQKNEKSIITTTAAPASEVVAVAPAAVSAPAAASAPAA